MIEKIEGFLINNNKDSNRIIDIDIEEEILSKGSQVPDSIPFINQEIYVETI